jgi:hypothetical protein
VRSNLRERDFFTLVLPSTPNDDDPSKSARPPPPPALLLVSTSSSKTASCTFCLFTSFATTSAASKGEAEEGPDSKEDGERGGEGDEGAFRLLPAGVPAVSAFSLSSGRVLSSPEREESSLAVEDENGGVPNSLENDS